MNLCNQASSKLMKNHDQTLKYVEKKIVGKRDRISSLKGCFSRCCDNVKKTPKHREYLLI